MHTKKSKLISDPSYADFTHCIEGGVQWQSLEAAALLESAFFKSTSLYHPQRWHCILPALKEWSALVAFHQIGLTAMEASGKLEAAQLSKKCVKTLLEFNFS